MDTRPPRGSGGAEPWRDEPNRVAWRDAATGLQCLILRGPLGALCGYVRVPRDHALHGRDYRQRRVERGFAVHGGLTFSGCLGGRRMKRGHWFGFDCAHWRDIVPGMVSFYETLPDDLRHELTSQVGPFEVYRTVSYVQAECTALAEQLARKASR